MHPNYRPAALNHASVVKSNLIATASDSVGHGADTGQSIGAEYVPKTTLAGPLPREDGEYFSKAYPIGSDHRPMDCNLEVTDASVSRRFTA